jgi:hypothetical protein
MPRQRNPRKIPLNSRIAFDYAGVRRYITVKQHRSKTLSGVDLRNQMEGGEQNFRQYRYENIKNLRVTREGAGA